MMLSYFAYAGVAGLVLIAAYYDGRFMIIPNWISVALIIGFVGFSVTKGFAVEAWIWHVGVGAVVFLIAFGLFVIGAMGGGDVKLLAATSLWFGLTGLLPFIFYVTSLGALLAIGKMIWIGFAAKRNGTSLNRQVLTKSEIPYGIAIALGTILAFPQSVWMS
jgi:prepilin peptidase CpaA